MDDSFRKNDLAYLEVDLLVLEDLDVIDPSFYAYVLEYVYCEVYDLALVGDRWTWHFMTKIIISSRSSYHLFQTKLIYFCQQ